MCIHTNVQYYMCMHIGVYAHRCVARTHGRSLDHPMACPHSGHTDSTIAPPQSRYIHTYIHTCIHTYIHAYLNTYH